MAEFLDGFPRYPKMHPCGVVLSRQPMHELTPTFVSGKGYSTTQLDMDAVEAIGLIKIDVLAQGGLAVMRDVKGMLRAQGVVVNLDRCEARIENEGRNRSTECAAQGLASQQTAAVVPPELRTPNCKTPTVPLSRSSQLPAPTLHPPPSALRTTTTRRCGR